MTPALILASASPRRQELLAQLNLKFEISPADIDESLIPGEAPADYVARLAAGKAQAVLKQSEAARAKRSAAVVPICLGSDTCVVIDDEILGKPCGQKEGEAMLERLSGSTHQVYTGVHVCAPEHSQTSVVITDVTFRAIVPGEAAWYWHTGEPKDKAGGYGIQGIGGIFVQSIKGSYSAVVGLPLVETRALIRDVVLRACDVDVDHERLHG